MDELILKYLSGDATDVERHRIEKWRESSADHDSRFREIEVLWTGLGQATPRRSSPRPDIDAMLGEAERRRSRARAQRSRRAFLRSPWVGYGLAAAASIALAIFAVNVWQARHLPGSALSAVESSVGEGQVVAMTLSDGSYVRLAPGTHVEFPARSGHREVVVRGRAFFAVSPGAEPFVVRTPAGQVTVHGTRFEVATEGDTLRVVVVEGVVDLSGPGGGGTIQVHAGQMADLWAGEPPRVTTVGDVWSLLDWPGALLAFQRTPLREVAVQLARHFKVVVKTRDSLVLERRVTGSFQDDSLGDVLTSVCAVTAIHCDQRADTVLMGGPGG